MVEMDGELRCVAFQIAINSCHIMFGLLILAIQVAAYFSDLRLKTDMYDIGVIVGGVMCIIGLWGLIHAIYGGNVSCFGYVSIGDHAFRISSSLVGAVISFILLGLS